jgi:hypothetical protein
VFRTLLILLFATAVALVLAGIDRGPEIDAADAEAVALDWVGVGYAQEPRRDGDEWEVDVIRPNGSMVEVTIGDALEARGFDEELGPGGGLAPDEVRGPLRAEAVEAAMAATGSGQPLSVEREKGGGEEIEVSIRTRDELHVEVELDDALNVSEVEVEDPRDE